MTVADLQAGSSATLQLADGEDLTAVANAEGVATFTLVVPENAEVGAATLTATGTDKFGKAAHRHHHRLGDGQAGNAPSEPGFTPEAANLKSLKEDTQIDPWPGLAEVPARTLRGDAGQPAAGKWFYVYLNGDGLGWHQALADGTIEVNTPESTRPGGNKVVVFNEAGSLHGWAALKVTGPP